MRPLYSWSCLEGLFCQPSDYDVDIERAIISKKLHLSREQLGTNCLRCNISRNDIAPSVGAIDTFSLPDQFFQGMKFVPSTSSHGKNAFAMLLGS